MGSIQMALLFLTTSGNLVFVDRDILLVTTSWKLRVATQVPSQAAERSG